ncbi:hypothetical protein [Dysgonomonas sp. HGC4]|uniref:hypothetical protein n=1 Tax=Dysgonomonas sp. HGC4 TaxID=1658009 RepID=UPI00067FF307|nr:hypothetical protein [Dysgonomonas sp. HGC4]MBD8347832.1 hypothetical protein [Dysgonomonas sp. HGC4]
MLKGLCCLSLSIFLLAVGFQVCLLNAVSPLELESTMSLDDFPSPHKGWAGSNIYWNGSNLTFDVIAHANYQGVYFLWGSLWGISPSENYNSLFSLSSYWRIKRRGVTWDSIPRVNEILAATPILSRGKTIRNYSYLGTIHDLTQGIGDICCYLTEQGLAPCSPKKWRMPTITNLIC